MVRRVHAADRHLHRGAATGNKVAGLWYPIAVALMTFVIGSLFLKESREVKIWDEGGGEVAAARAAGD